MMTKLERKQRKEQRERSARRIAEAMRETRAIVMTGKCPKCGSALRRNNALTGWWQCSQLGADGFRADSSKPACDWQGFTE